MDIVILDGYTENPGDLSWDGLEKLGNLTVYDRSPKNDDGEIIKRIGNAEVIITNKTPVRACVLDACPSIKLICLFATGYDVVDYVHAGELGIPVCNVPAYSTASVGQWAAALLLEICSNVGAHSTSVHAGKWEQSIDFCYWDRPLIELAGKTLGIIGFGQTGKAFGRIAKAMGMRILATGSRKTPEGEEIGEYVDMDTLLQNSDVVSLHCPMKPETAKIINRDTIFKMRDGVIIINTGRGGLVDEQALADALTSGKVYAAGVDVVSVEPITTDNPLLTAPNCFITPHIAWAPKSCRQRVMDVVIRNIEAYRSGKLQNVVNGVE